MKILGIESSCDDTGIAFIEDYEILANVILKQEHKKGVIPEYAARAHHQAICDHAREVIAHKKIDLIAYTAGPGLIGSLFVGACFAKGFSYASDIPSIAIHHLEAHILLPYWMQFNYEKLKHENISKLEFPYVCLLVSGGHTMIILVKNLGEYYVLSRTLDDAVGEVFDKVARHIGLDYPGGPNIEKLAREKTADGEFVFPNVMHNRDEFSFSGLKTAAIGQIDGQSANAEQKANFCSDFQNHIANLLVNKVERIYLKLRDDAQFCMEKLGISNVCVKDFVISGGVAANETIRAKFNQLAQKYEMQMHYPPIALCTDNGLMIAALGQLLFQKNGPSALTTKIDPAMPFAQKVTQS